jgi:hypothetical protein
VESGIYSDRAFLKFQELLLVEPSIRRRFGSQNMGQNDRALAIGYFSPLTFAHSGTVVNDKGSDIFVISHGVIVVRL